MRDQIQIEVHFGYEYEGTKDLRMSDMGMGKILKTILEPWLMGGGS